jgi:cholesterol transport system auxiliary component
VLIFAPLARPIYDTTRMAYSVRPYQIAYFSKAEWAEKPSRMMQPLLVQTLRKTRYFTEVLSPPYAGRYTHALQSEIVELRQDFTSNPATLSFVMRFRLSAETLDQLLATREISVREPMRDRTSYAGVVAANDAAANVLQELARFVIEAMNQGG